MVWQMVWRWLDMAVNEVCILEDIPRLDSSGETNRFEKCEAQLVGSLSKGLQVGDCWDVKTIEQTRPHSRLLGGHSRLQLLEGSHSRLMVIGGGQSRPLDVHSHLMEAVHASCDWLRPIDASRRPFTPLGGCSRLFPISNCHSRLITIGVGGVCEGEYAGHHHYDFILAAFGLRFVAKSSFQKYKLFILWRGLTPHFHRTILLSLSNSHSLSKVRRHPPPSTAAVRRRLPLRRSPSVADRRRRPPSVADRRPPLPGESDFADSRIFYSVEFSGPISTIFMSFWGRVLARFRRTARRFGGVTGLAMADQGANNLAESHSTSLAPLSYQSNNGESSEPMEYMYISSDANSAIANPEKALEKTSKEAPAQPKYHKLFTVGGLVQKITPYKTKRCTKKRRIPPPKSPSPPKKPRGTPAWTNTIQQWGGEEGIRSRYEVRESSQAPLGTDRALEILIARMERMSLQTRTVSDEMSIIEGNARYLSNQVQNLRDDCNRNEASIEIMRDEFNMTRMYNEAQEGRIANLEYRIQNDEHQIAYAKNRPRLAEEKANIVDQQLTDLMELLISAFGGY
ncbi:hypothetical protein LXL04_017481 [Taraxacum kok-saghyz]